MASFGERMVGAMKADVRIFEEIEADPGALGQAVTVIIIAGVAAMVGNIFRNDIASGIGALLMSLIGYAIWTVIVVLVGTKLMPEPTTKADFAEGFRVIGFAAAPGVLNIFAIIPFLGILISFIIWIWSLVIMVVAVRSVLDYSSTGRAIVVCLIGFIINMIITFLIMAPLFVGRMIAG
jgi:hypothetical protein